MNELKANSLGKSEVIPIESLYDTVIAQQQRRVELMISYASIDSNDAACQRAFVPPATFADPADDQATWIVAYLEALEELNYLWHRWLADPTELATAPTEADPTGGGSQSRYFYYYWLGLTTALDGLTRNLTNTNIDYDKPVGTDPNFGEILTRLGYMDGLALMDRPNPILLMLTNATANAADQKAQTLLISHLYYGNLITYFDMLVNSDVFLLKVAKTFRKGEYGALPVDGLEIEKEILNEFFSPNTRQISATYPYQPTFLDEAAIPTNAEVIEEFLRTTKWFTTAASLQKARRLTGGQIKYTRETRFGICQWDLIAHVFLVGSGAFDAGTSAIEIGHNLVICRHISDYYLKHLSQKITRWLRSSNKSLKDVKEILKTMYMEVSGSEFQGFIDTSSLINLQNEKFLPAAYTVVGPYLTAPIAAGYAVATSPLVLFIASTNYTYNWYNKSENPGIDIGTSLLWDAFFLHVATQDDTGIRQKKVHCALLIDEDGFVSLVTNSNGNHFTNIGITTNVPEAFDTYLHMEFQADAYNPAAINLPNALQLADLEAGLPFGGYQTVKIRQPKRSIERMMSFIRDVWIDPISGSPKATKEDVADKADTEVDT